MRLEKQGYPQKGEDCFDIDMSVPDQNGEVIRCPYCGSEEDCEHTLAVIDTTWAVCEGGYSYERFDEFRRVIEEYFLQQLRKGTRNVSGRRDKLIGELWNESVEKYSPGDEEISIERYGLTELIIDLFEALAAKQVTLGIDHGLPGFACAYRTFYAKKPKTVFRAALAELRARLKKAKLPKSKAGRTMPVDKPMRQSPTSEREVRRKQKLSDVAQLQEANVPSDEAGQATPIDKPTRLAPLPEGELRRKQTITLPSEVTELEEANLPSDLATALSGKEVTVELVWERSRSPLRPAEPWDEELLIDSAGKYWSEYSPLQVFFKEESGKIWRFPRRWVPGRFEWFHQSAPIPDSRYHVATPQILMESIRLPTYWDLLEINIPCQLARTGPWGERRVAVRISPWKSVRVTWSAQPGAQYMIPHTWRRRRVQLPNWERLTEEGVPRDVATQYAGRVVSVNYHPGSLCCLPEHYRFRDEERNKWRVKIRDCFLIGYGDAEEHPA